MTIRLTRERLAEAYGAENLLTVPAERLPDSLVHGPTREFLTSVGFPNSRVEPLVEVDEAFAAGLPPMAEHRYFGEGEYGGWELPVQCGDFLLLGDWNSAVLGVVGLEPRNGTVHVVSEMQDEGEAALLNSSVDRLAYFLLVLHLAHRPDFDPARFIPPPEAARAAREELLSERIRHVFLHADPAALQGEESIWEGVLMDMDML
ncbi:SUKH-4 family immunity protein [Thermomonospora catenispora]|uniref:SUKH-4 family immunity protein n=1 Tax=Thermomonospora catenispora TaxID=2493090 RepID=UPI00111ED0AB|nr:SUKH-4 family immunity protein [Thermomonospora catenispora]TNY36685.1 hypothetical protein EIO00_11535 [Thermomonospora catenispora]